MSSSIEAQLGSKLAIDDRSTSCCQSTLIASKCDHLDRAMLLLAFLDSPGVFFMLAMIGIVDCTFCRLPVTTLCPIPFPFFCAWNGHFTSVWTGQNGNITAFLAATVYHTALLQVHFVLYMCATWLTHEVPRAVVTQKFPHLHYQ